MAEACIGMSLVVFVWVLFAFSSYMANNRLRTVMAARDAAWLQSNGQNPSSLVPTQFFYGSDQNVAQAPAGRQVNLSPLGSEGGLDSFGWSGLDAVMWSNTVTFGMTVDQVSTTEQFPFVLLNTHAPFMPDIMLSNFLSVSSVCAWPGDLDKTWASKGDALGGVSIPYVP